MRWFVRVAAIVLLGGVTSAQAQVVFETAATLNLVVADDGYNGTLASMACANVGVTGATTVKGVRVLAFLDHTWVGDLVVKVVSPANTVITLMSRPGVVEAADDGVASGGSSANLLSTFPVEFVDGGAKSAELMGSTLADTQVVCRDDGACSYDPNNGAATTGKLAAFIGQAMAGTWKLCVGDGGFGDTGRIMQARLTFISGLLQVTPASTDFGSLLVGTTSTERFVTLANNGNATLSVNSIALAMPPFARTASGTCGNSLPRVLAIGESCTLSYTYTPTSGTSTTQTFQVLTNGAGDLGFDLKGTGTQPDAMFLDGFE